MRIRTSYSRGQARIISIDMTLTEARNMVSDEQYPEELRDRIDQVTSLYDDISPEDAERDERRLLNVLTQS